MKVTWKSAAEETFTVYYNIKSATYQNIQLMVMINQRFVLIITSPRKQHTYIFQNECIAGFTIF